MIAPRTAELLSHLREGTLHPADTAALEQTSATELVDELRSVYRLIFQERQIGRKREVSLAREFRAELKFRPIPDAIFACGLLVPAYVNCVMLNVEGDAVTGISRLSRLTVWAVDKPE